VVRKKSVGDYLELVALHDPDGLLARKKRAGVARAAPVFRSAWETRELQRRAARRSKSLLKWKVRCLRADLMFTLTKRGRIATWCEAWRLWKLFEQMCSRRFRKFNYVVTIEPHQVDGWHIHFVVRGYHHINTLRLFWHRVLLGQPRMLAFKRGDMSPGNVKMSDCGGGHKKLGNYLAKYLSKTFEELRDDGRVKRFASSKGIEQPRVERSFLPSCGGAEVFVLRKLLEEEGWKITGMFESVLAGEVPMIWLQASMRGPPS
jgi:hypothetical protein